MMGKLKAKNLKLKTTVKILKVLIFVLLLYTLHFTLLASPVFAQTPSSSPSATTPYTLNPIPSTVPPTSPIYTDLLVHNLFHTFSCLSVGASIIGQPCLTYQITQNAQGAIQSIPVLSQTNLSGGALGATTSLIAALYMNPPVRTVDYLASLGESFGLVKEAKAQVVGSGAQVLNPILSLWTVSRNIAYLVMIIIFVIVGLMVMFRNRINPQTVITAQAALPGLVIGLILITFSYFFAALLTDTAFIGTNLVGYYFVAAQPGTTQQNLVERTADQNSLTIMSRFIGTLGPGDLGSGVDAFLAAIDKAGGWAARVVYGAIAFLAYQYGSQVGPILAVPVGTPICVAAATVTFGAAFAPCVALTNLIGQIGGGAAAFAAALASPNTAVSVGIFILLIFILVYTMLRLLLRLLNNFLSIIFLVVTAPFHFLAASLPGRQDLATTWILNMLCNVLAFPAVMAVFYFANYILGPRVADSPFLIGAQANLVGAATLPLFGGLSLDFIRFLLAFGALMATPAVPDIICRTVGRIGVAGQLIGQEIGGAYGAGQRYAGQAGQAPGAIGRDISGLGQIPSTSMYRYTIDPLTGQVVGQEKLLTPGLGRRIRP